MSAQDIGSGESTGERKDQLAHEPPRGFSIGLTVHSSDPIGSNDPLAMLIGVETSVGVAGFEVAGHRVRDLGYHPLQGRSLTVAEVEALTTSLLDWGDGRTVSWPEDLDGVHAFSLRVKGREQVTWKSGEAQVPRSAARIAQLIWRIPGIVAMPPGDLPGEFPG